MITTTTWTANPSRIGLPSLGRTYGMHVCVQSRKGAFVGTSAWRPPIC